jgi:hypothetical protein
MWAPEGEKASKKQMVLQRSRWINTVQVIKLKRSNELSINFVRKKYKTIKEF